MPTPNVYFKIIIGFVVLFISFCGGFYVEHLRFVDYKDGVIAQAKIQEEHNKELIKQQQLVTEKVSNDYKNQLDRIKSYYAGLHYTSSSNLSSPSTTLVSVNGYTTDLVFAQQCADTTAQLVSLQDFVKEQLGLK
jgi:uncharacterized protein YktB (UPF0637 family)